MKKTIFFTFLALFIISGSQAFSQLQPTAAVPANDFLNSIGVNTSINSRGENIDKTIASCKYLGIRWIRAGVPDKPETTNFWRGNDVATYKRLHNELGIRFSMILPTEGDAFTSDGFQYEAGIPRLISGAKEIINALSPDAIIAFEGCNEPNNWGITYQGKIGGGRDGKQNDWAVLARYHRDFYQAVKADPVLGVNGHNYPVWSFSDTGGCPNTWNVGVQYLTVPEYDPYVQEEFRGVTFADVANIHNYFIHPAWGPHSNNQNWTAADPVTKIGLNSLYGNFGRLWSGKHLGHSDDELVKLPRVTTETGTTITQPKKWDWDTWKWTNEDEPEYNDPNKKITEEDQGLMYLSCYLSQFKRGFKYTSMYIMRDRSDEGGNQTFGFYSAGKWIEGSGFPSHPRLSAHYLHNMTTILADDRSIASPASISYSITPKPVTVHDLLLQKNNGTMMLVVWGEKYQNGAQSEQVQVQFDKTYKTINVYNPAQYDSGNPGKGVLPVSTFSNQSAVDLEMLNHPYIIELISDVQEDRHFVSVENGTANPAQTTAGTTVTITASAELDGRQFVKWEGEGISFADATNITTTFTMSAKNVDITATYEPKTYQITVNKGTSDVSRAVPGTIVTITADAPDPGKEFSRWGGTVVAYDNVLSATTTFPMPKQDVSFNVIYKNATSIQDINENTFLNTAKGMIIINAGQDAVAYSVYNVVGQAVAIGQAEGRHEINLPSSIYIVKINDIAKKLIVN